MPIKSLDAKADERRSTRKTQLDFGPARDAVDCSTGSLMTPTLLSCSAQGVLRLDAPTRAVPGRPGHSEYETARTRDQLQAVAVPMVSHIRECRRWTDGTGNGFLHLVIRTS